MIPPKFEAIELWRGSDIVGFMLTIVDVKKEEEINKCWSFKASVVQFFVLH